MLVAGDATWCQSILMAAFFPLLAVVAAFLVPVIPAQDPDHSDVSSLFVLPDVAKSGFVRNETQWWYDTRQKYTSSNYVLEYKGHPSSHESVSTDSLKFLSSEALNSSIVVQYYTSNNVDCGDTCFDMVDHYIQLAIHVQGLTNSNPATRGPFVTFHAINCAIHAELCQKHQITNYPTFRIEKLRSDGQYGGVLNVPFHHLHPYELIEKLGLTESEIPDGNKAMSEVATEEEIQMAELANRLPSPAYNHRSRIELLNDIHLALDHTLRSVVFAKRAQHPSVPKYRNEFTVTERDVLKSFLLLLHKTLPTTASQIQYMIHAVIDGFMYATRHHAYMTMLLDQHPPVRDQYTEHACATESYEDYNVTPEDSYRCVMWDLLHMMSVGMVDYNGQSYDGTEMLHPATSLHTIYEYVRNFGFTVGNNAPTATAMLESDADQKEFIKLYHDCSFFDRCNKLPDAPKFIYENEKDQVSKEIVARITTTTEEWKMVPLYVATLRNAVAQRQLPSSRHWPRKETCPVCWEQSSGDPNRNKQMTHDTVNLHKFLKVEYGHFDTLAESYRKELENAAILRQEDTITDGVMDVTAHYDVLQNDKETVPFSLKELPYRRDHKPIVPLVRHGSVCAIFFIGMVVRWFFCQRFQKKQTASSNESARTIQHTFENESVDHLYSSPKRRFQLSPTKRNRRALEKQQEPVPEKSSIPLERLEDPVDRGSRDERSPPEVVIHSSPSPSITSLRHSDSPASSPNGLSVSLSSQLRRRLPSLPITNS
jgi:hypothetical protein